MFVVSVTYGTNPHQIFAEVPDLASAKALQKLAIEKKYYDAEVMSKSEFVHRYGIKSAARQGGSGDASSESRRNAGPRKPMGYPR